MSSSPKGPTPESLETAALALDAALQRGEKKGLERAADVAENPYGDEVQAYGSDEPMAVGRKIAAAIRAMEGE